MPPPYFSIIIPTLNEAAYLPKLLTDLSRQTFTDFETIVVDAKSHDNTTKTAQTFSSLNPRIILSDQKNVGYQRNLGAQQAQAPWFIFSDADNQLPHYFLEGVKYHLAKNPTDAFTNFAIPDSALAQDKVLTTVGNATQLIYSNIKKPATYGAIIGVKSQVFHSINGFNAQLPYLEDWNLIEQLYQHHYKFKIYTDPKFICSLRRFRHEGTLKMLRSYAKIQLKLLTHFADITPSDYPMPGGEYYLSNDKPSLFNFHSLNRTLSQLSEKQKQSITRLLRSLFYDNI